MDPVLAALAAAAAFTVKGMASEAVQDAYQALKGLVAGKLTSLANLEGDPTDEDYQKATEMELQKKRLAEDPAVLEKASLLTQAIEREPPEHLAKANIDISELRAARDVIVKRLRAPGGVRVKNLSSAEGTIDIQDISAGRSERT
jgi:hypothetical protein